MRPKTRNQAAYEPEERSIPDGRRLPNRGDAAPVSRRLTAGSMALLHDPDGHTRPFPRRADMALPPIRRHCRPIAPYARRHGMCIGCETRSRRRPTHWSRLGRSCCAFVLISGSCYIEFDRHTINHFTTSPGPAIRRACHRGRLPRARDPNTGRAGNATHAAIRIQPVWQLPQTGLSPEFIHIGLDIQTNTRYSGASLIRRRTPPWHKTSRSAAPPRPSAAKPS